MLTSCCLPYHVSCWLLAVVYVDVADILAPPLCSSPESSVWYPAWLCVAFPADPLTPPEHWQPSMRGADASPEHGGRAATRHHGTLYTKLQIGWDREKNGTVRVSRLGMMLQQNHSRWQQGQTEEACGEVAAVRLQQCKTCRSTMIICLCLMRCPDEASQQHVTRCFQNADSSSAAYLQLWPSTELI